MIPSLKKILIFSLLLCYGFCAANTSVVFFEGLWNAGSKQYRVTSEKKSSPITNGPDWTVKTHTLPIHHTDLSVHVASSDDIVSYDAPLRIDLFTDLQSRYTRLECLPSKPRDPPLI